MNFNETKLRFGDVAMHRKDSCPIASPIYSGRGSRADCRLGDCAIFWTTVCRRPYPQLQHCSSIQSMNGMLMKSIGDNMTINEEIEKVRAEILKEALEITPKCYVENGDVVVDIKAFRKLVEWQSRYNSDTIHINIVHILENENTANIKIFKGYGDDILKLIEKSKFSEKLYEWAKPIYNRFREVTQQGCLESVTWILNLHFGDVVFGKELLEEIKDMEIFYDSEQKAIEEYAEVVRASRIIKDEPSLIRTTFQSILHRGEYCGKALVRMLNAVLRQADKIKRRTNCCAS